MTSPVEHSRAVPETPGPDLAQALAAVDSRPPRGGPAHDSSPAADPDADPDVARLYGAEAERDPFGLYERLREQYGPVAPVLLHGDLPAWLVLGYRENLEAMRNPSRFSRDPRLWRDRAEGRVAADNPLNPLTTWQPSAIWADGAEHERYRLAMTESIDRVDQRGLRKTVIRFTHQLVDTFCTTGHADALTQFAEHLPMMVMTQLFGMPESHGPAMVRAGRDLLQGTDTAISSNEYIMATLRQQVARRRKEPASDIVTWMLEHPSQLTDHEVSEHLRIILIAAFESTTTLIVNTLRMMLTDPRFRANLSGGHMTLPDAVEQLLWDEPPFTTILGRWAACDTALGGQPIRKGDVLLLGLAPANADPAVRYEPMCPMRGNRSHLAFSGGEHECPGQDLGRVIADAGIETMLGRLPDTQLSVEEDELVWSGTLMGRHLTALLVSFTPKPRQKKVDYGPVGELPDPALTVPPYPDAETPPLVGQGVPEGRRSWWRAFGAWLRGTF